MSRRRTRSNLVDDGGVDMTPMLDIVFILLIFFIVTSMFIDEQGVDFTQAKFPPHTTSGSSSVSIIIDAKNTISVEGRTVSLALVEAEVQRHLVLRPDASINLRAAETAHLESVVSFKDEMEQAGRTVQFETYVPTIATAGLN